MILLIIGIYDITQNNNPAYAPNRLGNLISQISSLRPAAKILLGNLPVRTDSAILEADQSVYNAAIAGIVRDQVSQGQHVYFVDMHSSFNASGSSPGSCRLRCDGGRVGSGEHVNHPAVGDTPSSLTNGSFEFGALVSTSPYTQYQLDNWSATGTVADFPGNPNCPATQGAPIEAHPKKSLQSVTNTGKSGIANNSSAE